MQALSPSITKLSNDTEYYQNGQTLLTKLTAAPIFHSTVEVGAEETFDQNLTTCHQYASIPGFFAEICVGDAYDDQANEFYSKVSK